MSNHESSNKRWIATAPGRINLIGEHTDYNLGYTLPLAINRYTKLTAEAASDGDTLTFCSDKFSESVQVSLDGKNCLSHSTAPRWSQYVAGVVHEHWKIGYRLPPLTFQIKSEIPLGAGLSSSASIEIAMAILVQKITGKFLTPLETALLCQSVEHQYVGVPCGLMDQLAIGCGRADNLMLLDCLTNSIEQICLPRELAIIVINSHIKHSLADGEYQKRRGQCEEACRMLGVNSLREVTIDQLQRFHNKMPDQIFCRARHVVTENARTVEAASRIGSNQWNSVGKLLILSHESMRDDFEISIPEIDLLVEIAKSIGIDNGVFGSRMTGGGFGGCTITLATAERAEAIRDTIVATYLEKTGIQIDGFVTHPSDGAYAMKTMDRAEEDL